MVTIGESEPLVVSQATIEDISSGGARLYLVFPLETGTRGKIEILFPVGGGDIKTETSQGKTIYSYHVQDTYYVGIEFDQELNPIQQPYLCKRIQDGLESF